MIDLNTDKFIKNLELHHNLYPNIPLQDVMLECILERSINDNVEHDSGSHKLYDFKIKDEKVSVKSGTFLSKQNVLSFSSHRTTKYKTIEEKINFINEPHFDYQINFAKVDDWKKSKQYKLFIFKKEQLNISHIGFIESDGKWSGETKAIKVNIVKKLSDQVWYKINLNIVKPQMTLDYVVPQNDLEYLSENYEQL